MVSKLSGFDLQNGNIQELLADIKLIASPQSAPSVPSTG